MQTDVLYEYISLHKEITLQIALRYKWKYNVHYIPPVYTVY